MTPRLPPPDRVDMEVVRTELRKRAASARESEAFTIAAKTEVDAKLAALNPEQGWWRKSKRRVGRVLRGEAVMTALSVGCSFAEIAQASGATLGQVRRAREYSIGLLKTDPCPGKRRWKAILQKAAADGLTAADVAFDTGTPRPFVHRDCSFHRIKLAPSRGRA